MMKLYLVTQKVLVAVLLFACLHVQAQNVQVAGKVTSGDDGSPLPGVSILEKGTTNGTVTDANGDYALSASENATLVFSFVGFSAQEILVGGRTSINVTLEADITALSEVVVIGYGEQEKKDVTGVVNAVDEKSFNKGAIVSPDQLIAGKIPGVQVTSQSGEPGAQTKIFIRGGTTLDEKGSQPLIVVDGFPIDNSSFSPGGFSDGRNPLNFLNPADIQTFTVLKDASAAAIYGSRAANGVIIITTKKGASGKPSISYDGWFSTSRIANQLDVFNAAEFAEVVASKAPQHIGKLGTANTDWQDQIFQNAKSQSHAVTLSGGSEKSTYRLSLGMVDQDGIVLTSNTRRASVGIALSQKALNDALDITVNLKGSRTQDRFSQGVVGPAMEMDPTQPIYDETSPWGGYFVWKNDAGGYERQATTNPVSTLGMVEETGFTNRSLGNIQFDYKLKFIPGLSANLNLGYDMANGDRGKFQPSNYFPIAADTGEIKLENYSRMSQLLEFYLNYKKDLTAIQSQFDFTAGYSWQDWNNEYPSIRATRLATNIYGLNNPNVARKVEASNSIEENRLISFFGRLNYSFKEKYLLTATYRVDGSTRFSPSNRWAGFLSAALAWRVIEEPFMATMQDVVSDLKIRVGYGETGDQEFKNYQWLPTYSPSTPTAQYQLGNRFISTVRPNGYDASLQWAATASFNFGIDFGFLNNRLTGSIDVYQKNTTDLLFDTAVPAGSNLTNQIYTNIGETRNSGVELTVNAAAIDRGDLRWNVSFNTSYNKNEIITVDGNDLPGFKGIEVGGISGGVGNNIQILRVGQPAFSFYVYKHKYGADGKPLVDGVDHNEDGTVNLADMYEDVSGDDVVSDADRRPFHNRAPKFTFGLTSDLTYKQFDLSFTLRAHVGNYVYNNAAANTATYYRANDNFVPRNMLTSVLETNFALPQYFSDYYVEDASFLRMDNLTLGFNAAELIDNRARLRVYGTVQNLFVLTEYTGIDPEVYNGIDNNLYPRSRTFIVGVNIGL